MQLDEGGEDGAQAAMALWRGVSLYQSLGRWRSQHEEVFAMTRDHDWTLPREYTGPEVLELVGLLPYSDPSIRCYSRQAHYGVCGEMKFYIGPNHAREHQASACPKVVFTLCGVWVHQCALQHSDNYKLCGKNKPDFTAHSSLILLILRSPHCII